jgi:hypothetical protein
MLVTSIIQNDQLKKDQYFNGLFLMESIPNCDYIVLSSYLGSDSQRRSQVHDLLCSFPKSRIIFYYGIIGYMQVNCAYALEVPEKVCLYVLCRIDHYV